MCDMRGPVPEDFTNRIDFQSWMLFRENWPPRKLKTLQLTREEPGSHAQTRLIIELLLSQLETRAASLRFV